MNKIKKESLGILIASTNRESLLDLIKCIKKDMGDLDYIIFVNKSLLHFAIREVATGNILFVINTNQLIMSGNTYPVCLAVSEDKKWSINDITLI